MTVDTLSDEKLAACPLCDNAAEIDRHRSYRAINGAFNHQVAIYCVSCGLEIALDPREIDASEDGVEAELRERWNNRPELQSSRATIDGLRRERPSYKRIIEIVDDCSERMKRTGESHRMLAKWISEGINAEFAAARADSIEVEGRGIYIASKTVHAQRWRLLRQIGYPVISTWIDEAGAGESQDLADLWRRCIEEASHAEVLVLNCDQNETLKGGWIELGAALASGVPVLAVGIEQYTVAKDRRIRHFDSIKDIMTLLKPMINGTRFAALSPPANEPAKDETEVTR